MMRGVLFDMDGVLFDTEQTAMRIFKELAAEMGLPARDEMLGALCSVTRDVYREALLAEYGPDFDIDGFDAEISARCRSDRQKNGLPVKKGAKSLLAYLRKNQYLTAVASSTKRSAILQNLLETNISGYFHAIVGGDMVKRNKPAPDIYLAAAKALQLSPSDCMAIEDSRNGIRSAHAAGCAVVMVPDFTPPAQDLEEMTIAILDSLDDVPSLLESNRKGFEA